jgi:hypothetical protein
MISDPTWLEDLSATSRQLLLAAAWLTGFVLALRKRPAAGVWFVSLGFALLALVRLGSLVHLLAFGRPTGFDSFHIISFHFGGTIYLDGSHLAAVSEAIACLAEAAGAALVVAGILRAWREADRRSILIPARANHPDDAIPDRGGPIWPRDRLGCTRSCIFPGLCWRR